MTNFIILFSLLFPDIYLQMYTLSYLTNRISFRKFFLTISIIFHLKVSAIEQNHASSGKSEINSETFDYSNILTSDNSLDYCRGMKWQGKARETGGLG